MSRPQKCTTNAWIFTLPFLVSQSAWCQTVGNDMPLADTRLIGQQLKLYEDTLYHNRQIDQQYQIIKLELRQLKNRVRMDELQRQTEELRRAE